MTPEQLRDELAQDDATLQGDDSQHKPAADYLEWVARYGRHTIDIHGPAPQYVEDELLAVERGWRRARVAWVVLGVLVVGFVVWRVYGGGQ